MSVVKYEVQLPVLWRYKATCIPSTGLPPAAAAAAAAAIAIALAPKRLSLRSAVAVAVAVGASKR